MKVLIILGTRPEAIKFAPLYFELSKHFITKICITAQHREMLDQVLDFFKIIPDYDLDIMSPNQNLFDISAKILLKLKEVIDDFSPDIIFVQGDTSSTLLGALAGFYEKIKIAHLEAGLRTYNKYHPFPEEMNRQLTSRLADIHFVPCINNKTNLNNEGINQNIFQVGNTVIDALLLGLKIIKESGEKRYYQDFNYLDFNKKIILITSHRRESFGEGFLNICNAIKDLSYKYPNAQFVYPVHLNPNVQKPVKEILSRLKNVFLTSPLEYHQLIWLMNKSYFVMTDSGGIQEEAPALGKPVLVMREVTERTEGVEAGTALLVGTDKDKIITEASNLFDNDSDYLKMSKAINPYGDGDSSQKVALILKEHFNQN
jgi:UDP-N-acetylglucosamine 2-epimerase (non-hydrolysing)